MTNERRVYRSPGVRDAEREAEDGGVDAARDRDGGGEGDGDGTARRARDVDRAVRAAGEGEREAA